MASREAPIVKITHRCATTRARVAPTVRAAASVSPAGDPMRPPTQTDPCMRRGRIPKPQRNSLRLRHDMHKFHVGVAMVCHHFNVSCHARHSESRQLDKQVRHDMHTFHVGVAMVCHHFNVMCHARHSGSRHLDTQLRHDMHTLHSNGVSPFQCHARHTFMDELSHMSDSCVPKNQCRPIRQAHMATEAFEHVNSSNWDHHKHCR